jgi:hypothetical protein
MRLSWQPQDHLDTLTWGFLLRSQGCSGYLSCPTRSHRYIRCPWQGEHQATHTPAIQAAPMPLPPPDPPPAYLLGTRAHQLMLGFSPACVQHAGVFTCSRCGAPSLRPFHPDRQTLRHTCMGELGDPCSLGPYEAGYQEPPYGSAAATPLL